MTRSAKKPHFLSLRAMVGLAIGAFLVVGLIGFVLLSQVNQDVRSNAAYPTSSPILMTPSLKPSTSPSAKPTVKPSPRVSPRPMPSGAAPQTPSCDMGGTRVPVGQCGCNVKGYENRMCVANNISVKSPNSCYAQCNKPNTQESDCNKIGDPEPACGGKKVGDSCSSVKNFSCQVVTVSQTPPYCDCLLSTQGK